MALKSLSLRIFSFWLVIGLMLPGITPVSAAVPGRRIAVPLKASNHTRLAEKVQANGALPVIVMLDALFQPEGDLAGPSAIGTQREAYRRSQNTLLARLAGYKPGSVKRFATIPFLALSVTPDGLAALEADPAVLNIEEDVAEPAALAESVPLIGAPAMWSAGYSGAGQVVAILDTGVDKEHPFLAGKVVVEACFSTTDVPFGGDSLCPGGLSSSIKPGSAMPYASGVCPPGECDHGTHVAGIVAGHAYENGTEKITFNGVAKDAQIIAIQVFSAFPKYLCNTDAECVMSYISDQILGMERVLELNSTYPIAAVNLSLGGGQYDNQKDCDQDNAARKAIIDNLRSDGIATVIASGNGFSANSLSAPACISSAISVGSTNDYSDYETTIDEISYYSNVAPFMTLLAPGDSIVSSIPGGQYEAMGGTSMAAPHVSGAWAILKQKFPNASVDKISGILTSSGKPVTDNRSWSTEQITRPRLNLEYAVSGHVWVGGASGLVGLEGVTVSAGAGHSSITDINGAYTVDGLPLGNCILTATLPGYNFTQTSQPLNGGPSLGNVDFIALPGLFSISGKVTLGSGPGAPGLSGVRVSDGAGNSVLTGADGSYIIENLSAGSYTISAALDHYSFTPEVRLVVMEDSKIGMDFAGTWLQYQECLPMVVQGWHRINLYLPRLNNH